MGNLEIFLIVGLVVILWAAQLSPNRLQKTVESRDAFVLWLAQGFGIGRIPFAPGTFGSILGLGWFALLLLAGNFWIYLGGTILGLAVSVWLCGAGEKILNQKDPGSVVMD